MEIILATLLMVCFFIMLVLTCSIFIFRQHIVKLKNRIRDSRHYVCILIENVYTFKNDPQRLRDRLLNEMTIKKFLCYHLVDDDDGIFPPDLKCTKKDKLLYKLHLEGFTPKELCILFELNNLNTVYVKCHRVSKKLANNDTVPQLKENPQ